MGTSWSSFQSKVLTPSGTKVAQSKVLNTVFLSSTEATFHALKMDLPSRNRQKPVRIKSSCFYVCGGFPDSLLLCQFRKAVYNEYFYFVRPSTVTPVRSVSMLSSQTSCRKWVSSTFLMIADQCILGASNLVANYWPCGRTVPTTTRSIYFFAFSRNTGWIRKSNWFCIVLGKNHLDSIEWNVTFNKSD